MDFFHSPPLPAPSAAAPSSIMSHPDPVRSSIGLLLNKAYSLPCSAAAQAYTQIVQPTSRFQLALDALLPLLDPNTPAELSQRILVAFLLYALYAPHPIAINPFKSVLFVTFMKERERAVDVAQGGEVSPNEQLVWVLWKILKGDGNDIGPYSPSTLARSPLPPKLRATNLIFDDEMYNTVFDLDDVKYSYSYSQRQDNPDNKNDNDGRFNTDRQTLNPSDRPLSAHSGAGSGPRTLITREQDRQNERIAQAMKLLLVARERTLTLSEQRQLTPLIPDLASAQMIISLDLAAIASTNPTLAHPLLVALLSHSNSETNSGSSVYHLPSPFLDVLPYLPPSLATFDLLGRLLRDQTPAGGKDGFFTVANVVRVEVLGRFVHECIVWLEMAEREEREGVRSDDRFAKGVQNLCRFYHSLIKLGIVDPAADTDSAEMAHFSLRNARFEDANVLYRALALGKF